ncbi:unnamed protein product [Psylliodes chrysocephalus]|uniref:Transposase n=1 Tax=Psylliodes chrysocephalus TaxID=3402493 RepID=A0A9P0CRD8_9CUCU|nr:unnamed protein product [Psylliodes chrysocephala]
MNSNSDSELSEPFQSSGSDFQPSEENESSSFEDSQQEQRPQNNGERNEDNSVEKRGRKTTRNVEKWARNVQKVKRAKCECYKSVSTGKLVEARKQGNDCKYNIENTPENVKYKPKAKFAKKLLVWIALSENGLSRPYVGHVRGPAVDQNTYIQNCLPKLVNFIKEHHANDNIMFCPDLASAHYARATCEWLEAQNVPFVPKQDNPPNVPQARPIGKIIKQSL